MFDGISVTCFAASYLVVMFLDFTRFYFRATARNILMIGFAVAGWIAHLSYLIFQVGSQWQSGVLVSSWESWCWIVSLILVSVYFLFLARHPKTNIGMYLMPVALMVIVAGIFAAQLEPFSPTYARTVWHNIHGISLLIGLIAVLIGFIAGVMYLVQSSRLKQHNAIVGRVKTLALESLQNIGERALLVSAALLAGGLISGVVLNVVKQSDGQVVISWSDPIVWTSAVLLVWLVVVIGFVVFYTPARQGRKIAYLVVASFLFLIVEIIIAVWSGHGRSNQTEINNWEDDRPISATHVGVPNRAANRRLSL